MQTPAPASLNRLQRWVLERSAGRYAALAPELRRIAIERDLFLTSRRSWGLWTGLVGGTPGTTVGLALSGAPQLAPWLAFVMAAGMFAGLFKVGMSVWLRPERYTAKRMWRIGWISFVANFAGAIASFGGDIRPLLAAGTPWYEAALRVFWRATPLQIMLLVAVLLLLLLLTIVSAARREYMARALEAAHAEQERETSARQLAQARLALLQAQIQPHFLFNTLAALQHWVDVGDARAAPLLRDLTSFLRAAALGDRRGAGLRRADAAARPRDHVGRERGRPRHRAATARRRSARDRAPSGGRRTRPAGARRWRRTAGRRGGRWRRSRQLPRATAASVRRSRRAHAASAR
jgi:hypothetical protein